MQIIIIIECLRFQYTIYETGLLLACIHSSSYNVITSTISGISKLHALFIVLDDCRWRQVLLATMESLAHLHCTANGEAQLEHNRHHSHIWHSPLK